MAGKTASDITWLERDDSALATSNVGEFREANYPDGGRSYYRVRSGEQ